MALNIITAVFHPGQVQAVTPIVDYQYDQKQILCIEGLELPNNYGVDFCNTGDTTSVTMVGGDTGVQIPDSLFLTGRNILAYIVLTEDESVQTRYAITIPVKARPARTDISPTPAEQQQIDTLIEGMSGAVESALKAEGFSVGEQNGEPVGSASPYYHNNARYYSTLTNPGPFFATFTSTVISGQRVFSCDKTFSEIKEAIEAGRVVIGKDGSEMTTSMTVRSTYVIFYFFNVSLNTNFNIFKYTVRDSGTTYEVRSVTTFA